MIAPAPKLYTIDPNEARQIAEDIRLHMARLKKCADKERTQRLLRFANELNVLAHEAWND